MTRFSEAFWGTEDKGLSVLLTKLRNGRITSNALLDLITARANLEEEYGKKLLKISKMTVPLDDMPCVSNSFTETISQMEKIARNHINLATDIRSQIQKPLVDSMVEQRTVKHQHKVQMTKLLKSKESQTMQVVKLKEKYFSKCEEKAALTATGTQLQGKELEKHDIKLKKANDAAQISDDEYSANVAKLKLIHEQWKSEMVKTCDEFQRLEETRMDFTKITLDKLAELSLLNASSTASALSCVRNAIANGNPSEDLQAFITANATGKHIPPPLEYINYYTNSPSTKSPSETPSNRKSELFLHQPPIYSNPNLASAPFENASRSPLSIMTHSSIDQVVDAASHASLTSPGTTLFKVKTLYAYAAQADEELSFASDEIINVTSQDEDPWWFGYIIGKDGKRKTGIFPSNFVERLP